MRNFSFVISEHLAGMAYPGTMGDLQDNLEFLKSKGISTIVTLTVSSLDEALLKQNGFSYLHIPIMDFRAPTIKQIETCINFTEQMINENKPVVIHCQVGIGRTGTMLACYLVKEGMNSYDAIDKIRDLRPGSIETREQENVILEYSTII